MTLKQLGWVGVLSGAAAVVGGSYLGGAFFLGVVAGWVVFCVGLLCFVRLDYLKGLGS